jgi:hypothetical protein
VDVAHDLRRPAGRPLDFEGRRLARPRRANGLLQRVATKATPRRDGGSSSAARQRREATIHDAQAPLGTRANTPLCPIVRISATRTDHRYSAGPGHISKNHGKIFVLWRTRVMAIISRTDRPMRIGFCKAEAFC